MMEGWKDKRYRPKPGTEARPDGERGAWKRWGRSAAKRRWRMKHDAGFRDKERRRTKELRERARKPCPGCGKSITRYSRSCIHCRSGYHSSGSQALDKVKYELSTPYKNGENVFHERNIQRLEAELREARV